MAAERAGDAAFSEDQVDLAVEQLQESNAGPALRATLARVTGRLAVRFNGEVAIRAETQDMNMEIWGVVRVVSNATAILSFSKTSHLK